LRLEDIVVAGGSTGGWSILLRQPGFWGDLVDLVSVVIYKLGLLPDILLDLKY
jgi:hypothetical protein